MKTMRLVDRPPLFEATIVLPKDHGITWEQLDRALMECCDCEWRLNSTALGLDFQRARSYAPKRRFLRRRPRRAPMGFHHNGPRVRIGLRAENFEAYLYTDGGESRHSFSATAPSKIIFMSGTEDDLSRRQDPNVAISQLRVIQVMLEHWIEDYVDRQIDEVEAA